MLGREVCVCGHSYHRDDNASVRNRNKLQIGCIVIFLSPICNPWLKSEFHSHKTNNVDFKIIPPKCRQ